MSVFVVVHTINKTGENRPLKDRERYINVDYILQLCRVKDYTYISMKTDYEWRNISVVETPEEIVNQAIRQRISPVYFTEDTSEKDLEDFKEWQKKRGVEDESSS